jgi:hypothetical protein
MLMANQTPIKPLFILAEGAKNMAKCIVRFTCDDYNKELGAALIDAKNDAEAISTFLNEYKESEETLRSYAKEVERLLLWCIHVAKINISSLRRNHLTVDRRRKRRNQAKLHLINHYNEARKKLIKKGENEDASTREKITVHWLRHAGISDDFNKRRRPIIHVCGDAGQASIATSN